MNGRILAVDPGEKRIGIAVSDPTAMIARPLCILQHISREQDAKNIARIAVENEAVKIVVGMPLDMEGRIGPKARRSERLMGQIKTSIDIPVVLWDETNSSVNARSIGVSKKDKKTRGKKAIDDIAAAVILQSYLDSMIYR